MSAKWQRVWSQAVSFSLPTVECYSKRHARRCDIHVLRQHGCESKVGPGIQSTCRTQQDD